MWHLTHIEVSIPIWCDWWFSGFLPCYRLIVVFQFLYGAIGGSVVFNGLNPLFEFQFLYGAIGGVSD